MPTLRVTSAASSLITAGKAAGKSSRQIADEIQAELGVTLDQRTISRHLGLIAGKRQKRRQDPPATSGEGNHSNRAQHPGADAQPSKATLDEVAALEVEVLRLQVLLARDLPPRDRTALNSELRQTFKSIRHARKAIDDAKKGEDADVKWMAEKLKRFAAANAPPTTDDRSAVPVSEERDTAGSG
jgi:hypothetical protein